MKERRTYFVHEGEDYSLSDIVVGDNSVTVKGLRAVKELRRTFILSELPREYFTPLRSLDTLVAHIKDTYCSKLSSKSSVDACSEQARSLLTADYLDIDYDVISGGLVLNAFWSYARGPDGWVETVGAKQKGGHRVELGFLRNEKSEEEGELKVGGHLIVAGDDDKPKQTLFSFPSRHLPLPTSESARFQASFKTPTGLHPTLELQFPPSGLSPPSIGKSCALHAYLTLPSFLFIDKYPFSDPLFLESHNLKSLRSLSGETDLEAPDWVIKQWGSAALFELADPPAKPQGKASKPWSATIPMHLRYLSPNNHSDSADTNAKPGEHVVDVPWPVVFWACHGEISGSKMAVNPFDRVNLGYDGLFGDRTIFYHVPAYPERSAEDLLQKAETGLYERLHVPVLDLRKATYVSSVTVLVVALGAALVAWWLVGLARKTGQVPVKEKRVEGKDEGTKEGVKVGEKEETKEGKKEQ